MKYQQFKNRIKNKEVKAVFATYPEKIRGQLLFLRETIFEIASQNKAIGEIEETLKWENPSYLTNKPKSGTTIRLSKIRSNENKYAISVHCQTTLVSEFKEIYPDMEYDGNRSLIFDTNKELPLEVAQHFIFLALTYHTRKNKNFKYSSINLK